MMLLKFDFPGTPTLFQVPWGSPFGFTLFLRPPSPLFPALRAAEKVCEPYLSPLQHVAISSDHHAVLACGYGSRFTVLRIYCSLFTPPPGTSPPSDVPWSFNLSDAPKPHSFRLLRSCEAKAGVCPLRPAKYTTHWVQLGLSFLPSVQWGKVMELFWFHVETS